MMIVMVDFKHRSLTIPTLTGNVIFEEKRWDLSNVCSDVMVKMVKMVRLNITTMMENFLYI